MSLKYFLLTVASFAANILAGVHSYYSVDERELKPGLLLKDSLIGLKNLSSQKFLINEINVFNDPSIDLYKTQFIQYQSMSDHNLTTELICDFANGLELQLSLGSYEVFGSYQINDDTKVNEFTLAFKSVEAIIRMPNLNKIDERIEIQTEEIENLRNETLHPKTRRTIVSLLKSHIEQQILQQIQEDDVKSYLSTPANHCFTAQPDPAKQSYPIEHEKYVETSSFFNLTIDRMEIERLNFNFRFIFYHASNTMNFYLTTEELKGTFRCYYVIDEADSRKPVESDFVISSPEIWGILVWQMTEVMTTTNARRVYFPIESHREVTGCTGPVMDRIVAKRLGKIFFDKYVSNIRSNLIFD